VHIDAELSVDPDHLSKTPFVVPRAVLRVAFGGAVAMLVTCRVGQIGETTL